MPAFNPLSFLSPAHRLDAAALNSQPLTASSSLQAQGLLAMPRPQPRLLAGLLKTAQPARLPLPKTSTSSVPDTEQHTMLMHALQSGTTHEHFVDDYLTLMRSSGQSDEAIFLAIRGHRDANNVAAAMQNRDLPALKALLKHLDTLEVKASWRYNLLKGKSVDGFSALHNAVVFDHPEMVEAFVHGVGSSQRLQGTDRIKLLQGMDRDGHTCLQLAVARGRLECLARYLRGLKSAHQTMPVDPQLLGNSAHGVPNMGSAIYFHKPAPDPDLPLLSAAEPASNAQLLATYLHGIAQLTFEGRDADRILLTLDENQLTLAHYVIDAAEPEVTKAFGAILDQLPPEHAIEVLRGQLPNGRGSLDTAMANHNPECVALYHRLLDREKRRIRNAGVPSMATRPNNNWQRQALQRHII